MTLSPLAELSLFGTCLLCGGMIGLLFDLFRVPRRIFPPSPTLTVVTDLCFFTASALLTAVTLFHANGGVLRGFELFGLLLGFLGYLLTLSKLLLPCLVFLLRFLLFLLKKFLFFITILPK